MDPHIKRAELIGRYIHDALECSFRIYAIGDTMLYVTIEGDKELLKFLSELLKSSSNEFGVQCKMNACNFRLTPDQYNHFINDVLDKNVAWTITTKTAWYQPNKTITIPGTWRKLIDGGRRKRSGRKRSGRKRSGRKRSQRTATRRRKI